MTFSTEQSSQRKLFVVLVAERVQLLPTQTLGVFRCKMPRAGIPVQRFTDT